MITYVQAVDIREGLIDEWKQALLAPPFPLIGADKLSINIFTQRSD